MLCLSEISSKDLGYDWDTSANRLTANRAKSTQLVDNCYCDHMLEVGAQRGSVVCARESKIRGVFALASLGKE